MRERNRVVKMLNYDNASVELWQCKCLCNDIREWLCNWKEIVVRFMRLSAKYANIVPMLLLQEQFVCVCVDGWLLCRTNRCHNNKKVWKEPSIAAVCAGLFWDLRADFLQFKCPSFLWLSEDFKRARPGLTNLFCAQRAFLGVLFINLVVMF